ncbi:hypothetical protein KBW81_12785 [Loktanella salsilacus]|uniref:hypothetical protein n=1 Tax=Loktanella salsilacus TaxID=195913 RepID=UPI0020B706A2|nr:hypothetical protein [Loktanella salsilacus]UTH47582.1 hypothetical protein KBW81_12785 [Loktanella salsilacus]
MKKNKNITRVRDFLKAHDMKLQDASHWLGGRAALMRCHRLRQRVANASKMDYGIRRELDWLAGLLALRVIDDYEFVESNYVTDIDLHNPIVEVICLLSEEIDLVVRDIAPEYETAPLARQIDAA